MKAIVFHRYGSPDVLRIEDVQKPVPIKNELLVKVKAAAINDYDWSLVRGKPFLYRLMFGLSRPKRRIPGMELSGIVEAAGPECTAFKVGDFVFGDTSDYGFGAMAEYICVDERSFCSMPANMNFEEATTLPHAGLLALQSLWMVAKIKAKSQILINGAGGGVGCFAIQLIKERCPDSIVTGVDTKEKAESMLALGYDATIDYKAEDFTKNKSQYDLILDCKTNRGALAYAGALKKGGSYVTVGGSLSRLFQLLLFAPFVKALGAKHLKILSLKPNKGMDELLRSWKASALNCRIEGPYQLEEFPEALRQFGEGKHKGKIVISIDEKAFA